MLDPKVKTYLIQFFLFILTVITTTIAGAEWMTGRFFFFVDHPLTWQRFSQGFYFSLPFLGILTAHEFGHYITARLYKVRVTLPYYIPLWLGWLPGLNSLGTMGAFIRIQSALQSRRQFFDIGIAGPLAGFVLALGVLFYGFTHLPPREHIFTIHPDYKTYGLDYDKYVYSYTYIRSQDSVAQAELQQQAKALAFAKGIPFKPQPIQLQNAYPMMSLGNNLVFQFYEKVVVSDRSLIPNPYEMMHYPLLLAGYFALFFTALNLIPIGQLDGGHILYSLIGARRHSLVSPVLFIGFVAYAGLGVFKPSSFAGGDEVYLNQLGWLALYVAFLFNTFSRLTESQKTVWLVTLGVVAVQLVISSLFPMAEGYNGWLVFGFVLGRFLGVYHPPALYDEPLDRKRQVLGWVALVVFVLCFTPYPLSIVEVTR